LIVSYVSKNRELIPICDANIAIEEMSCRQSNKSGAIKDIDGVEKLTARVVT